MVTLEIVTPQKPLQLSPLKNQWQPRLRLGRHWFSRMTISNVTLSCSQYLYNICVLTILFLALKKYRFKPWIRHCRNEIYRLHSLPFSVPRSIRPTTIFFLENKLDHMSTVILHKGKQIFSV